MQLHAPVKRPKGITVSHFFNTHGKKLKMELMAGASGIERVLREGSVNRPALALTGFYKFFSNKCIQVLGAAEMTYLRSFDEEKQYRMLRELVKRMIPCIVLSRSYVPTRAILRVAEETSLPIFRTPMITKHFINLATVALEYEFAPTTVEHGTLLDVKGIGTLLKGKSGVGKSECALALVERNHSLVADDLTYISLINERDLIGRSSELNRGYMECRGIGIINVAEMFGIRSVRMEKRIDLVVNFREWEPGMEEERTGLEQNYYEILGMKVPFIELPVRSGRDLCRLVEVAALTQALKRMGHDSAREFNDRLIAHMARNSS
jgi:HPr kinase/phosphorylase